MREGGEDKPAEPASAPAPKAELPTARLAKDLPPRKADAPRKDRKVGPKVAIELEVTRQRLIGWTVFGIVVGALLVWKLGTVGQWIGVVLVAIGLFRGYLLLQTFLHKPGTIIVTEREVTLPRGLCMPRPIKVAPSEISAVYFLRRSVPWNKASPVLVVEMGGKAIAYPRDWFASEADQRHIVHALLKWSHGKSLDPAKDARAAAAATPAATDAAKLDAKAEAKAATPVDADEASPPDAKPADGDAGSA